MDELKNRIEKTQSQASTDPVSRGKIWLSQVLALAEFLCHDFLCR